MKDFIAVYDDVVSEHDCGDVIEAFNYLRAAGFTFDRQTYEGALKNTKNDLSAFSSELIGTPNAATLKIISSAWSACFNSYVAEFEEGFFAANIAMFESRIQKTDPGQGYHVWHSEQSRATNGRVLAWTLYLNDVAEGGETEFLYQSKRVSPKTGRVVIWPAGWTHIHRGNPPLSGEKYIVTGWAEYV